MINETLLEQWQNTKIENDKLQQENQRLKEENSQLKLDYELYKNNCVYRNYEVETKDNIIKQLKDVIEEVREYVENNVPITHYSFNGILEILDKAKVGDK